MKREVKEMISDDLEMCKKNLDDIEDLLFQIGELNASEVLGKMYNCLYTLYSIVESEFAPN